MPNQTVFYVLGLNYALLIAHTVVQKPKDKEALRITLQALIPIISLLLKYDIDHGYEILFYTLSTSIYIASLIYNNNRALSISNLVIFPFGVLAYIMSKG